MLGPEPQPLHPNDDRDLFWDIVNDPEFEQTFEQEYRWLFGEDV